MSGFYYLTYFGELSHFRYEKFEPHRRDDCRNFGNSTEIFTGKRRAFGLVKKKNVSVIYRYELNGEPLCGEKMVNSGAARNLKIGEKVKLCYNPQNHKEVEINRGK